jgi:hypothetical protein
MNQFTLKFRRIWCFVNGKDVYTGQYRPHGRLIRKKIRNGIRKMKGENN